MALSPLILVVDDTDATRRATVLVLEKAGFRVADAVDGTSALRCIPELSPDLVLLDAMMPDIGGIEVLRRLRADPRMAHLPVVILSSQLTQAADQAEGLDAGADGYIARPISNVELVARVRAMLRSQELSRQLRESEARFRELITQQTDGLLVVDAAGRIQFANPAAARIFGRRIEDLVGLPFGFPISSGTPVEIDGLEAGSSGRILEFFASATQWDLQPAHLISLRDITERKRSVNLLALRARQQEVIARLGIEASRTISLDDIFRLATSRAAEALDMELSKVLQLSPDRSRLRLVAGVGWDPGVIGTATVSSERESQAGFALMQGIPVVSDDLANETRFRASPLLVEHQVRSGMSTIIYLRGTPWGVLGVHSRRPRQFSEQDSHFLQSVATLLSVVIERLAAAREQSASTQRMREAQRIAHLGSWELDIPTKKLSWSEEVFRMFGVEPSAFAATYEGFFAFVHPDDRDAMQTAQQAALSGGGALEIEHRIIRPDGSIRHVLERGELIHDDSGQPVALSGTVLDTTDLRAAQNRAERMNTLLTEAQQIANMGSWEMDLTSGKLVWSEETCRLFGIRPEEFGGTFETFTGLILPEDLTAFGAVHAEITPEAPLLEAEYRIRRPDGEVRWMFERGRVAFDAAGKAVRRQGVVMDVTERKRAEADLRESEQLLRIAGHIAHMGAWSVDFPDVRITWSDEVCAIHDMPAGTVPALDQALAFYTPESRPVIESAFSLCASEGTPFDVEIELLSAKKQGKWVRSIGQAERDQTGAIRRVHGAFQDISEQKKAQAEALRAAETLAGIVEVQQEIANVDLTSSDVLRRIAEHAMVLTGAAGGAVEMVDGSDMVYAATAGMVVDDVGPPKLEGGLSGVAVATGRVLCCDDTETDSRVDLAFCRALGVRAMIVAPVHVSGEIVGVLKVLSDKPGAFGKRDIHNLQILAETLGVVIQRHRAADALRGSMEEFRRLAEAMPQIVWVTRADGWTTYFNQHWMDYTGLTLEESLGHGWNKPFHPDDQQRAWEAWQRATSTVGAYSLECRLRRADGQYRWWLIRGKPQQDAAGTVQKWFGTCTDIHDLKIAEEEITRSNRALTMLSRCNEALIRSESESGLLAAVCQIAVDIGGFRLAWVGYALDDAEKTIACQSHAGLGGGYLANVRITWGENDPAGQGPAGRVIRHGEPVVIPDFESDEGFRPWLQAARAHGFRGTIALPLANGSRTFGVFVLYQAEVRQPLPDELRLLQELADDMAFGIVNLRARADRQRMHTAVEQVAASVSAAASTDFFEQLTRNMVAALGAKAGFVAKVLPDEPVSSRTIAVVVDDQVTANFDYVIQGTPCENFYTSDTCVIHEQVARQFPLSPTLAALGAEGFVGRRLDNAAGTFIGQMVVIFREPLKDPDFVVSTLQIFSARAAAELERQETDTRLREQAALLDAAQDAILVRDLDHRLTYWNRSAERLYGWTAQEVLGRSMAELLSSDPGTYDQAMEALLADGEWTGECRHKCKDGRILDIEGRWTLVRDAAGQPKTVLAIHTDVTDRRQHERLAQRSQRLESIGTLAGGIAHDLNNALAPITMSGELLRDAYPGESELLDMIDNGSKRAADMVRQLLAFAKGAAGERVSVQTSRLVMELEKLMMGSFPKNIRLVIKCDAHLPTVLGDATQLHQVLLNLCVNARDAMPSGGTLAVSAESQEVDAVYASSVPGARPGQYLVLRVRDTGTGIPPELLDRVFDPFFTTKGPDKGTGLGLSTVMGIVKGHDGFLQVYSQPGQGSTFAVYLPAEAGGVDAELVTEPAERFRGQGETILFVDDEPALRQTAHAVLQRMNFTPLTATDGADGLIHAAKHRAEIHAIITDLHMPHMDGLAFVRALRRMLPDIPVLVASGRMEDDVTAEFKTLGVTARLDKPFTERQLAEALKGLLRPR